MEKFEGTGKIVTLDGDKLIFANLFCYKSSNQTCNITS